MNNTHQERIVCAAIWFKDGNEYIYQPQNIKNGFVVLGLRHSNCFYTMKIIRGKKLEKIREAIQGFLTSNNRFVERPEAAEIAFNAGQISKFKKELSSEDLY